MLPLRATPWIVLSETELRRWGGDLRRSYIFRELVGRTGALEIQGWTRISMLRALWRTGNLPVPWRTGPFLASSELMSLGGVSLARRSARPVALDVHDHPIVQTEALGRTLAPRVRASLESRISSNLDAFPLLIVPSRSFAELVGLDPGRIFVAPNASDTSHVVPLPFPERPTIGFVSGAAPGRGIELLVESARLLRAEIPDLRLQLWLASADQVGAAYVSGVRHGTAADPWIEVGAMPYERLAEALGAATLLVIPHPANAYLDVAVPIKLLDSMAAGRPVVVTPRTETRRIVEEAGAGCVAAGDTPADIAAACLPVLNDQELARRLGASARAAAERDYDWRVVGSRVADAALATADALGA